MAKSSDSEINRVKIGETSDKEPIVQEEQTGKTFVYMNMEKAEQFEKLRKEKEKANMADEKDVSKLMTEIAELKADAKNKEKAKYDKFLEGLAQKVDNVCTEVGGCRKDIGDLKSRIEKDKEKTEKDSKETCVGLDCVKNSLKELKTDTGKLTKLDQLDKLDLYDCPECNRKIVPLFPEPANYCPGCGKTMSWLEDDGKPLKSWHPPWKH